MRRVIICAMCAVFAGVAMGQAFEVASIKPSKTGSGDSDSDTDQGMLHATNITLKSMIVTAYGVRDYQVEGPDWLTDRFDVVARFPEALPKDRDKANAMYSSMMRKLLEERFHLAVRRETKQAAVYGLVAAKGGIKFKEVPDTGSRSDTHNTHYEGRSVTMGKFADVLSRRMDLPVLDMTGLKGFYDVTLDWVTEGRQGDGDRPLGLLMPEALQEQLGLKLENRKAPMEMVVVERVDRLPTEN